MRVILKDNVPGLGQKDDVKNVKPGYWRNLLLPQGLAVEATLKLIEEASKRKEEREKELKTQEEKLTTDLKKLGKKTVVIETKADEKGGLFEGIDSEKISKAIKEQAKVEIEPKFVELEKPIKKTGLHEIAIKDIILKVEIKPLKS